MLLFLDKSAKFANFSSKSNYVPGPSGTALSRTAEYLNALPNNNKVRDGLMVSLNILRACIFKLKLFCQPNDVLRQLQATQSLHSILHPQAAERDIRHSPEDSVLSWDVDPDADTNDPNFKRPGLVYQRGFERAGVTHFVSCWGQQGKTKPTVSYVYLLLNQPVRCSRQFRTHLRHHRIISDPAMQVWQPCGIFRPPDSQPLH